MGGCTAFTTTAVEKLPQAVEILDPINVVKLVSKALEQSQQRAHREQHGRRGLKDEQPQFFFSPQHVIARSDG